MAASSSSYGAAQFPALTASAGDLYGASSFRMCEAQEYALDLDALEREELALEQVVQALVERKAGVPIGVKFHRALPPLASAGIASHGTSGGASMRQGGRRGVDPDGQDGGHGDGDDGAEEDDGEEEDDDMDEDEMDEEDEMNEEDELEDEPDDDDDDDAFPLDGPESDGTLGSGDEDPFAREDDSLDDVPMDMDTEEEPPRRETW